MKRHLLKLAVLGAIVAPALATAPAHAQATRTWVSGVGDDANPCSRTAPCKTFAGAISKTAASGMINCLDPGGFGTVTITKNMTIDCEETLAGVLGAGTNGINIPTAGVVVNLRGLDIEGIGTGLVGVNITGPGAFVHIKKSKIFGWQAGTAAGVRYVPSVAGSGGRLVISDSVIHTNGTGVLIDGSTAPVNVVITNTSVDNNSVDGVSLTANANLANAMVSGSTLAFNGGTGLKLTGVQSKAAVGSTTIFGNGFGVTGGTGTLTSFKNNQITGNTNDGTPINAVPGGPLN